MIITIYSTSTCAICHALMQWLDKKGVAYKDVVIDETDEAMNQLLKASEGMMVTPPFTVVTKDDGTEEKVLGFDRAKISALVGIE